MAVLGGAIGRRRARAAMAGALLATAAVGWTGASGPAMAAGDGSWQAYANAFPVAYSWRTGPRALVADPVGCFVAFGADTTGYGLIPGYWQSSGDCTQVASLTPKPGGSGDGPPSSDDVALLGAVAAPGGGYLAIGRHTFHNDYFGYDSFVVRGDPHSGWHTVASFTPSPYGREGHVGPAAVALSGDRLVAVGQRDGTPLAWTSTDGANWQEEALPVSDAASGAATAVAGGPDGRIVALGTVGGTPVAWTSGDGGGTWQQARMPQPAGTGPAVLYALVRAGSGWLALGGSGTATNSTAVVYGSPDGVIWTADDGAAAAGALALRSAAVLPDGTVLAGAGAGAAASSADQECARVWRLRDGTWTAEDLGCDGVPAAFAALTDGRVAASHGTTLFLSGATS